MTGLELIEIENEQGNFEDFKHTLYEKSSTIGLILGARGTGKSALGLRILENVAILGYGKKVKIDTSLVRGLEYYTSAVFEISLEGAKWSVAGGGRYDNLIETFGGKPAPATGISLGIERLFELLKAESRQKTLSRVYIANVNNEVKKDVLQLSKNLRNIGVPNEYDLMGRDLRKQLDYANSKGIPYLIVLGPKEIASGKIKLRDMKTGEEKEISLSKIDEIKF